MREVLGDCDIGEIIYGKTNMRPYKIISKTNEYIEIIPHETNQEQ